MNKEFLGDRVFINHTDYYLTLTTENESGVSNRIYLDANTTTRLILYIEKLKQATSNGTAVIPKKSGT